MSKRIWVFISALCISLNVFSQKIENVRADVNGDQMIITYDLIGAAEGQEFRIQMYSSNNNFTVPLLRVTGDIGNRIPAGLQRRVVWMAKEELKEYKGAVTLEIRGEPLAPAVVVPTAVTTVGAVSPYTINSPSGGSVKKGKNMTISWIGGARDERVQIELWKNDSFELKITEMLNSGNYTWTVADGLKGSYKVKIKGSNGETVSNSFKVGGKSKVWFIVVPVVVVGAVLLLLPKDKDLPEPPTPN